MTNTNNVIQMKQEVYDWCLRYAKENNLFTVSHEEYAEYTEYHVSMVYGGVHQHDAWITHERMAELIRSSCKWDYVPHGESRVVYGKREVKHYDAVAAYRTLSQEDIDSLVLWGMTTEEIAAVFQD